MPIPPTPQSMSIRLRSDIQKNTKNLPVESCESDNDIIHRRVSDRRLDFRSSHILQVPRVIDECGPIPFGLVLGSDELVPLAKTGDNGRNGCDHTCDRRPMSHGAKSAERRKDERRVEIGRKEGDRGESKVCGEEL